MCELFQSKHKENQKEGRSAEGPARPSMVRILFQSMTLFAEGKIVALPRCNTYIVLRELGHVNHSKPMQRYGCGFRSLDHNGGRTSEIERSAEDASRQLQPIEDCASERAAGQWAKSNEECFQTANLHRCCQNAAKRSQIYSATQRQATRLYCKLDV